MPCHLFDKVEPSPNDFECLERVETFVETDHFDLNVCACKRCGQKFLTCFVEITMTDDDDDCWSFFLPVSDEDVDTIRKNKRLAIEFINSRKHITIGPTGRSYWKTGPEIVLSRGSG